MPWVFVSLVFALGLVLVATLAPWVAAAQSPGTHIIPADRLEAFAWAQMAVDEWRDKAHAEFAEPKNKNLEGQPQLRSQVRGNVAAVPRDHGLPKEEFERFVHVVSSDTAQGRASNAINAQLATPKGGGAGM